MAQSFDEHVTNKITSILEQTGEVITTSHLMWLQRQYAKVLVRSLELDRREEELTRREAAQKRVETARPKRSGKKSHRVDNQQHGGDDLY